MAVGGLELDAGGCLAGQQPRRRFSGGIEIVDELGVELAGRPLRLGPPNVLVMDEELDGVHGSVDGVDPRR